MIVVIWRKTRTSEQSKQKSRNLVLDGSERFWKVLKSFERFRKVPKSYKRFFGTKIQIFWENAWVWRIWESLKRELFFLPLLCQVCPIVRKWQVAHLVITVSQVEEDREGKRRSCQKWQKIQNHFLFIQKWWLYR